MLLVLTLFKSLRRIGLWVSLSFLRTKAKKALGLFVLMLYLCLDLQTSFWQVLSGTGLILVGLFLKGFLANDGSHWNAAMQD